MAVVEDGDVRENQLAAALLLQNRVGLRPCQRHGLSHNLTRTWRLGVVEMGGKRLKPRALDRTVLVPYGNLPGIDEGNAGRPVADGDSPGFLQSRTAVES